MLFCWLFFLELSELFRCLAQLSLQHRGIVFYYLFSYCLISTSYCSSLWNSYHLHLQYAVCPWAYLFFLFWSLLLSISILTVLFPYLIFQHAESEFSGNSLLLPFMYCSSAPWKLLVPKEMLSGNWSSSYSIIFFYELFWFHQQFHFCRNYTLHVVLLLG